MSYQEKNFQTEFSKENKIHGVFELKLTKDKSIRFDALAEHQKQSLLEANGEKGLFHKITDFPMFKGSQVRFNRPKPFDCFKVKNYPAYVVIMFYEPRKKKSVYYITINNWIFAEENSKKKSIREEEIKNISSLEDNYLKK